MRAKESQRRTAGEERSVTNQHKSKFVHKAALGGVRQHVYVADTEDAIRAIVCLGTDPSQQEDLKVFKVSAAQSQKV